MDRSGTGATRLRRTRRGRRHFPVTRRREDKAAERSCKGAVEQCPAGHRRAQEEASGQRSPMHQPSLRSATSVTEPPSPTSEQQASAELAPPHLASPAAPPDLPPHCQRHLLGPMSEPCCLRPGHGRSTPRPPGLGVHRPARFTAEFAAAVMTSSVPGRWQRTA